MCLVWDPSARHSPMSLNQVCIPSAPAKKRLKRKYHCDVYFIAMQLSMLKTLEVGVDFQMCGAFVMCVMVFAVL